MMEVQKYLKEHGIQKLQDEFAIMVTTYPDRVVLNYNQIESPRFHPICDECRALILRKDTWEVMARSFDRFYNWGESIGDNSPPVGTQRIAAFGEDQVYKFFDLYDKTISVQEKVDGSLISIYNDGEKWCASTRKMAFAEGQTTFGRTFAEIFWAIANQHDLIRKLEVGGCKDYTMVFELTGPENRVVTPYAEPNITLIGGRLNKEDMRELFSYELDDTAQQWGINRPKTYTVHNAEELITLVESFPSMEEGVVLVIQSANGSHWRVKCKNPKFVAIAHMRENGNISPKRILTLIMENDHFEYLKYFPEDERYFRFVEGEYLSTINRMKSVYREVIGIADQKTFALTMMPKMVYSFEKGILFAIRKNGGTIEQELLDIGAKKISQSMGLRGKFAKMFGIETEEEE